jgi:hypothetical protein
MSVKLRVYYKDWMFKYLCHAVRVILNIDVVTRDCPIWSIDYVSGNASK